MLFYQMIFVLCLSIRLTNSQSSQETTHNNLCSLACDIDHSRDIPKCNNESKLAPFYHKICDCLLGYKCCHTKCPNLTSTCKEGRETEELSKDECGCPVKKCVPCLEKEVNCGHCQMKKQSKNASNGCLHFECASICVDEDITFCPRCYHLETVFDDNCNCSTGHCVPTPCPQEEDIQNQDCTVPKIKIDSCGCKTHYRDKEAFCAEATQKAQNFTCPSMCHEKEISIDKCGCEMAQCVLKTNSQEPCSQMFGKSEKCPDGSHLVTGLSACGSPRHVCLPCPEQQSDNTNCSLDCHIVKRSKDMLTGCPITECRPKKCAKNKIPNCRNVDDLETGKDECGCLKIDCKQSRDAASFSYHSNLLNWTEAQRFCQSKNGHLAVIPDVESQRLVMRAVGPFDHWIGAKCRKYPAYSSFYWTFPNGTRLSFIQSQAGGRGGGRGVGDSLVETCDDAEGGLMFSSQGFNDEKLMEKRHFVCQYV